MKLNYKRTLLVGFAFFLISVFWQAYDSIIPKILTDKFGMSQFWSGAIMAIDNVLAVFMLPIFGALSDKTHTKRGKRTPFVIVGTIIAVIAFVGLSFADNMQLAKIEQVAAVTQESGEDRDRAMEELYSSDVSIRISDGDEKQKLSALITEDDFMKITPSDEAYNTYVVPARQAYAGRVTDASPRNLIVFIGILLIVLISMATFRSPAVALMPDVTPKPLRSKANAIINLMGTAGGIIVLVLGMVFGTGKASNALMSYTTFFLVTAGVMVAALVIFTLCVKEPKWASEADEINAKEENTADSDGSGDKKLSRGELTSLLFILLSVVFWFMGYNAVTSKYSVYAGSVLNLDYNLTLIVAQAAAIVSYIPVGIVASKIGRKKTIIAGVIMLGVAFGAASFMRSGSNIWVMNALFALAGVGWATINVNSYPMVVELARGGNVGRYTGFYYTASMSAQIITPVLSGAFLTNVGMTTLFPYAAIFVAFAFVTMQFVKHGDSKPAQKKDMLENLDIDD